MVQKKLDNLSKSVIVLMNKISKNRDIMQLLLKNSDTPFREPATDEEIKQAKNPLDVVHGKILPFPFSPTASTKEQTTIRVFFPTGTLDSSSVWSNSDVVIDIVVARGLWLIKNERNEYEVRPYRIMSELVTDLSNEVIHPMGLLKVSGFEHLSVNQEFDALRLFINFDSIEFMPKD